MSIPAAVDNPTALTDAELHSLLRRLERDEQTVSRRRSTLHNRIDFVQSGGFASAAPEHESLESLQATEVDLSERRNSLHQQVNALRVERSRREAQL